MAVGERAQERAQRRGCPQPAEELVQAAVPDQVKVVDRVRAREHPSNDAGGLVRRLAQGDFYRRLLALAATGSLETGFVTGRPRPS